MAKILLLEIFEKLIAQAFHLKQTKSQWNTKKLEGDCHYLLPKSKNPKISMDALLSS